MATPKSRDPEPEKTLLALDVALLSSWKDIAAYFGKGVRTVQRWEREFDLPVRRTKQGPGKSAVFALPDEINAWVQARAIRAQEQSFQRAELVQLRQLIADLRAEMLELRRHIQG